MKRLLLTILLALLATAAVNAQRPTAGRVMSGSGTPPATCNHGPPITDIYYRTSTNVMYTCTATDTWTTQGTGTVTSVSVTTANGVSGSVATSTTTPAITVTLGAITPTTVNGNTLTTGTYTLTGAASKTLTFSNSLTLAGTDSTTMTFPTTSATVARTDAANAFTGHQTIEGVTSTGATGTGNFVFSASPTFTGTVTHPTPFTLGAISVTSTGTQLNYLNAATGTTGTASTNVVFSTSPTLVTPALGTPTAIVLTSATGLPLTTGVTGTLPVANGGTGVTSSTGTVAVVLSTSPTLITPVLGVATATSLNGNTFTTGTYTLTGTAAKTLTFNNSLTLAGTDATTMTFPAASATVAGLGTTQTFTGIQTLSPTARSSGAVAYLTINIPADTAQTAATESIGINHVTATRQWASTGTVALQRENFFAGPTYSSASASQTFTDAFTLYATPPVAGTNAIFTRGHTLGIVDSTSAASAITGGLVVATTLGTAATSVGIGGGNINAGGTITAGGILTSTVATGIPAGAPPIQVGTTGGGMFAHSTSTLGFVVNNGGSYPMGMQSTVMEFHPSVLVRWGSTGSPFTSSPDIGFARNAAGIVEVNNGTAGTFRDITLRAGTFSGALINTGITTDATHADSTVCQDTTTHQFYAGSGTIGICLGTSSIRYKTGWRDLNLGLPQILALNPGSFHYIKGYGDDGRRLQYGLKAEDVVSVLPALVGLDEEGKPNSVDLLGMVPILVRSIQQLEARINKLEKRQVKVTQ